MSIAQLINPEQLAERQKTPGLVILDCATRSKIPTMVNAVMPRGVSKARLLPI